MSRTIQITKGYEAIVDDEDYEYISSFRWSVFVRGQRISALRHGLRSEWIDGKRPTIVMSRFILGLPPGRSPLVDHANGDALDNRRCNLRIATGSQNCANRRPNLIQNGRPKASRYKGVSWQARKGIPGGRWIATVGYGHKRHLGTFDNEISAAIAYNEAALSLFGEFALLNQIEIDADGS